MTTSNRIAESSAVLAMPIKKQGEKDEKDEQIEGYDPGSGLSGYPIDEILIRQDNRTVYEVTRRIEGNRYIMDPDFQRDFVWDIGKQSRLIESVIMRIPLPVFYLAEDDMGKMIVVDGLQRLTTFSRFLNNEFKLKLKDNEALNGRKFDGLEPKYKNRIEDCNLTCYIIDSKVPERARLDIFERVNGGEPLSRQQMRNALYSGPGARFLREEAKSELFKEATGNSLKSEKMRDREFVNRFCAFYLLGVDAYKGDSDMDAFLAKALEKMNGMSTEAIDDLSESFRRSLDNNFKVFGKHAFRKSIASMDDRRSVINASLWDVMSTELARYAPDIVIKNERELYDIVVVMLQDRDFNETITLGTNDYRKVHARFAMANNLISKVLKC